MFKRVLLLFLIIAVTILPLWFMQVSAAPNGATRFVATGGIDGTNDCLNINNPCATVIYAVQQTDTGDTVIIASGWYTETDTIRIFRDITIQGAGLEQTIISVENNPDIWQVFQVYGNVDASINHLAMRNAERSGVQNLGNLTIAHVSIAENRGVLGGGITNSGVITVTDSIIDKNGTGNDVAAGMLNYGQATIQRSMFVGNKASSYGGGLHNQGVIHLENVTFAYNEAQSGTAVSNGGTGEVTMINVTIANNIRTLANATSASAVTNFGTSIEVANTLIANNGPNQQCDGDLPLTSLGHNLESGSHCNLNQPTDLASADPYLESWVNVTGTPNWISALSFAGNSPALDAGDAHFCPATDARGTARPVGNGCNIGAYEFNNYRVYLPIIVK